jgi:hypothetical protein
VADEFSAGRIVYHRSYFGGELQQVAPARVVRHDDAGVLLWLAHRSPSWLAVLPDRGHPRDVPPDEWPAGGWPLVPVPLPLPQSTLILVPPDAGYAVWWLWRPGGPIRPDRFAGWYVNLERHALWDDGEHAGVDSLDQELDGLVDPDRRWRWKDEDSFAAKTGQPRYWSATEAAAIRAAGESARALVEAGAFPFDGSWRDFVPDPSWPQPARPVPEGWRRPPTLTGR